MTAAYSLKRDDGLEDLIAVANLTRGENARSRSRARTEYGFPGDRTCSPPVLAGALLLAAFLSFAAWSMASRPRGRRSFRA